MINQILDNIRLRAGTDWVAVVDGQNKMTYAELEVRSEAIAFRLVRDFKRGETVCLWGDKENDMLCFIVACMKSGHPYVVLSSYFPALRVRQIAELAHPCAMLCAADDPPDIGLETVFTPADIDRLAQTGGRVSERERLHRGEYLTFFFTSGSTGVPKCVPTTVDAASDTACAYGDETEKYIGVDLKADPDKQLFTLNIASYAFCSSLDVIFNNFGRFGTILYAVSHELSGDYERLYDYIKSVNPHTFDCSPQFLSMCLTDPDFNEKTLSNLRMLSVGGENLSRRIGLDYMQRFEHVPLCNGYGATEMCSGPMWCRVTREMLERYDVMPIGNPISGSSCFIEDEDGKIILEDNTVGELVVQGSCLTTGYLHDPERTAAVFKRDAQGKLCYHTNDLVLRRDGQYFYVGRKDNLVKVGGYRVELDETEKALSDLEGVESCAVVPVVREGRTVMLAAYVVLKEKPVSVIGAIKKIRGELLLKLQPYMVPQKILFVDGLPLNANGKIDRAKLKKQSEIV